jgi:hypothetical protein
VFYLAQVTLVLLSRGEDVTAAAASAKRLAALVREARTVQHRLDKLAAAAAGEDSTTLAQLAEARDAIERLVDRLARQEWDAAAASERGAEAFSHRGRPHLGSGGGGRDNYLNEGSSGIGVGTAVRR